MSHLHSIESPQITIRMATAADSSALARIAGRDSAVTPTGEVLVAAVGDEVRVAMSLSDATVVADPFHRTTELVEMLRIRAGAAATPSRSRGAHRIQRQRPHLAFRATA